MRDFRKELANDRCWEKETHDLWLSTGIPKDDTILQNREELIGLCEFIEANKIRSYLEIGAWTGRLITVLHRLFQFDKIACCDVGMARQLGLPFSVPEQTVMLKRDSHSASYLRWREELGPIDLVMIDGDHTLEGVKRDFAINKAFPHRFLAFHDIVNPYPGIDVARFWRELEGNKVEIVRPLPEVGWEESKMGIGIWSAS